MQCIDDMVSNSNHSDDTHGDKDTDPKDDEDADVEEDNSTLLEEALISSNKDEKKRIDDEVNALKDESEMPIEELMKRYGYSNRDGLPWATRTINQKRHPSNLIFNTIIRALPKNDHVLMNQMSWSR